MPQRRLSRVEAARKTEESIRKVAGAFWPRIQKQATGELLNERVAAERAMERILLIMRDEVFPEWLKGGDPNDLPKITLKQKDRITTEVRDCFKLCQLTNADTKLFDTIMDRLAPRLQQVEHKAEVTHNHVVMLPETQSPEDWIEGHKVDH